MSPRKRPRMRIAQDILDELSKLKPGRGKALLDKVRRLCDSLARLQSIAHRLEICLGRGFGAALQRIAQRIDSPLRDLPYLIREVEQAVKDLELTPPSLRGILESLRQTEDEFGRLQFRTEDGELVAELAEVTGAGQGALRVGALGPPSPLGPELGATGEARAARLRTHEPLTTNLNPTFRYPLKGYAA